MLTNPRTNRHIYLITWCLLRRSIGLRLIVYVYSMILWRIDIRYVCKGLVSIDTVRKIGYFFPPRVRALTCYSYCDFCCACKYAQFSHDHYHQFLETHSLLRCFVFSFFCVKRVLSRRWSYAFHCNYQLCFYSYRSSDQPKERHSIASLCRSRQALWHFGSFVISASL